MERSMQAWVAFVILFLAVARRAGGRNAKRAAGRKKMRMSEYMGSPSSGR